MRDENPSPHRVHTSVASVNFGEHTGLLYRVRGSQNKVLYCTQVLFDDERKFSELGTASLELELNRSGTGAWALPAMSQEAPQG